MFKKVLDFFFPQKCLGCGAENFCICEKCLDEINFPAIFQKDAVFSAADYNDLVLKQAIWRLKYHSAKVFAPSMAALLYQRILSEESCSLCPLAKDAKKSLLEKQIKPQEWILIPIPLSNQRRRQRGFNQSELIANHLAKMLKEKFPKLSITVATNVLCKKFHTDTQVSVKNKKYRAKNLAGSSALQNAEMIKNKNVAIIDDVTTTGATIAEAIKTLRLASPKKIIALAVASG